MPRKSTPKKKLNNNLPPDVAEIVAALETFLDRTDEVGRKPCNAKCGVYAFYDYDDEPIYVGQTKEQLRVRIRRHMTNQRTDAVAMRVLDPLEVGEVAVWPFWEFDALSLKIIDNKRLVDSTLNAAEFTLFRQVIAESSIGRVLNEKIPAETELVELPQGYRGSIVPDELRQRLGHPDERIARRSLKIAELAGIIRQRDVSVGLRNTLVTQAERMLLLSRQRYTEITSSKTPSELRQETVGAEDESEAED